VPISLRLPPLRNKIVWLNVDPPTEAATLFRQRLYIVERCTDDDLRRPDYLAGLSTVVLTQNIHKPLRVSQSLAAHGKSLLDYDCVPIIMATGPADALITNTVSELKLPIAGLPAQGPAREQEPPLPYARYFTENVPWGDIANFVQSCSHRSTVNLGLTINVASSACDNPSRLDSDAELLVRRAFSDCLSVSVVPLSKGRSGADVFSVHARIAGAGATLGTSMQPYFLKVHQRPNTLDEYRAYEEEVHPYVPFYLTPHLNANRCCLGAEKGALVSDFVGESEKLLHCASDGRATAAIACLFDRTLSGWYAQAQEEPIAFADGLCAAFPTTIDQERLNIAQQLGSRYNLTELGTLFSRCSSSPVLIGPVHGDLHAGNVQVRATDAIAIDFGSHQRRPLLLDAAQLEASILVEVGLLEQVPVTEWLRTIRPLYTGDILACAPLHGTSGSWETWLYANIQQIRGYARRWQCGLNQYVGALSFALLEKARKNLNVTEPEKSRRAAAYLLTELVLETAFGPL
jgi:hypothetical protein